MKCPHCGKSIAEHEVSRLQYLDDMHDIADLMPMRAARIEKIIKALRAVVVQAPKVIVRPHGTEVCAFCLSHPVDDHYAHCTYVALPNWITESPYD